MLNNTVSFQDLKKHISVYYLMWSLMTIFLRRRGWHPCSQHREVKWFSQGHTACDWLNCNSQHLKPWLLFWSVSFLLAAFGSEFSLRLYPLFSELPSLMASLLSIQTSKCSDSTRANRSQQRLSGSLAPNPLPSSFTYPSVLSSLQHCSSGRNSIISRTLITV